MTSDYRYCTYCTARKHRYHMTLLPKRETLRNKWFNALGPHFKTACSLSSGPVICLSHFEEVQNCKRLMLAVPKPLPYRNNVLGERLMRQRRTNVNQRNVARVRNHGVDEEKGRVQPVVEEPGNVEEQEINLNELRIEQPADQAN